MDFVHILGQKEAAWNTSFSIFERRLGPQTWRARENFPPFPYLDGPVVLTVTSEKLTAKFDKDADC